MIRFLSVLLLLVSQFAAAADITITGPTKPINPGRMVRLFVDGLTEQELLSSSATVTLSKNEDVAPVAKAAIDPLDYVDIFPGKTWQNRAYIDFRAEYSGKYVITIDTNGFRKKLDEGLIATTTADIDAELLSELRIVVTKIGDKYLAKTGAALVEVAGTVPPPPVDPDDPIPPTTKVDRVTYVYEKDNSVIPRQVAFALQKLNTDSGGKIAATEFEEDSTVDGNPHGRTPSQYVIALKAAREAGLPALVVQSGDAVVKVIKNPTTTESVLEVVK